MINHAKNIIRERIWNLLRSQKEEDRKRKSSLILTKLLDLPEFKEAKTVLFYASFDGEVDTYEMMKQAKLLGKTILLPVVDRIRKRLIPKVVDSVGSLQKGAFGIPEPNPQCELITDVSLIDVVIVPGVAFDRQNNRLGRGGGYYDGFLKTIPADTCRIGLAYDFQVVDSLDEQEDHDVPVSLVLTN